MAAVIHTNAAMTSYQPFQCLVCMRRFTRHENLKRHAALHSRSRKEVSLPCDLCQATFSRPDLRHRHMKRKHAEHEQRRTTKRPKQRDECSFRPQNSGQHRGQLQDVDGLELDTPAWTSEPSQVQYADDAGGTSTASSGSPIENSDRIQPAPVNRTQHISMDESVLLDALELERSLLRETSFTQATDQFDNQPQAISTSQPPPDIDLSDLSFSKDFSIIPIAPESTLPQSKWFPSASQIREGCNLFFTHVSHFLPFLHHPTFDPSAIPSHLLLAMLSLAYQYGEDPECDARSNTGTSLSTRCYLLARSLLSSTDDPHTTSTTDHLPLIQTYLLLQICAMMYLCGSDSTQGLQMHATMISLARSTGLMHPIPTESAHTSDLDSLWKEFIKAESHKRTLFAVHQIDALWYQLLSIPRAISHLEVKHDLPCPENHWTAPSAAQWAHLQLVSQQQHHATSMRYDDAVRHFLSSPSPTDITSTSTSSSPSTIPPFDPYGAINITHFLISSAREISGWSTMTGMLSMERFSALRSSLLSLGVLLSPSSTSPSPSTISPKSTTHATATWQTAMIELQMWSPSHTGGIVKASIDTMLQQATELAPSACEFLCEAETAKAFQSHVDWFLVYLEEEGNVQGEAPWVTLYAYKAFLVAWQLVRGGVPGAMGVVGVGDGDVEGAVRWARRVFGWRERWVIGRLVMGCLGGLD
ncbi:hypothetical protein AtubIFM55763_009119 [Aspergillus tubingensis]|uniref:Early growth response protein 1 n=2 Tax=Aspergillus subgen. Circumdati TaxID=2720871 RepID=A0A100IPE8_ASPNG|nr:early growth response protein 1 [Aspergillus tubingensis]GAQ44939.1 early growth response protein 1 [Aspergillus niger]GFN11893.1 early growth response protein 1 [Aspergillus tubingensis]GLA58820.1 hypothetical protein AtubIFM54640_008927 [Aspergillus tubingensis]GLA77232.1 hypothetical protein AtubIFM55763_009119 [Aspergillus tubingensis]GLA85202.1 hypothetical protein AtubIFM56815_009433 [Aspergillus tubingensis]